MYIFFLSLLCLRGAAAYSMPVSRETGSAMDSVISLLRGKIPFQMLKAKPKVMEEKPFWKRTIEYFWSSSPEVDDTVIDPMFICNVAIILTLIVASLYILFARSHVLRTQPKSSLEPFVTQEGTYVCRISHEYEFDSDVEECERCTCGTVIRGK